jgi:hypothetical protein
MTATPHALHENGPQFVYQPTPTLRSYILHDVAFTTTTLHRDLCQFYPCHGARCPWHRPLAASYHFAWINIYDQNTGKSATLVLSGTPARNLHLHTTPLKKLELLRQTILHNRLDYVLHIDMPIDERTQSPAVWIETTTALHHPPIALIRNPTPDRFAAMFFPIHTAYLQGYQDAQT